MSRSTTQTVTCPCGKVFTHRIYEHINAAENPQLRYLVLSGLINIAACANCGRRAEFSVPFVYSDPAYNVLAYVHPSADVPDEGRLLIVERLRQVYKEIVAQPQSSDSQTDPAVRQGQPSVSVQTPALPPLRIVFGLEALADMLNGILAPEEKLGKLALNTQSRDVAERGQFLDITRKLATDMSCFIDVEDWPDEYTVWIYGSRKQISALIQALVPR